MPVKKSTIFPHLKKSKIIVDVGTGTGTLAAHLSQAFPEKTVVGVDISKEMITGAQKSHQGKNLRFEKLGADQNYSHIRADTAVFSSIFHEIFSYAGDSKTAVKNALRVAHQSVIDRIVIRDFVKPDNPRQKVLLAHEKSDITQGKSLLDFVSQSKRTYEAKIVEETEDRIVYETDMETAYEYMFRKDYKENWIPELAEVYGFMTSKEFKQTLLEEGWKTVHKQTMSNPWIVKNRLENKIELFSPFTGESIAYPDYQMLMVAEKVSVPSTQ